MPGKLGLPEILIILAIALLILGKVLAQVTLDLIYAALASGTPAPPAIPPH